jgi:hypothetical protein
MMESLLENVAVQYNTDHVISLGACLQNAKCPSGCCKDMFATNFSVSVATFTHQPKKNRRLSHSFDLRITGLAAHWV